MNITPGSMITILSFLGIPNIIAIVYGLNFMMLMDPVSFTFEELDKREKYIILNSLKSASFFLIIMTAYILSIVLFAFYDRGNIIENNITEVTDTISFVLLCFSCFLILSIIVSISRYFIGLDKANFKIVKKIFSTDLHLELFNYTLYYVSGLFLIYCVVIYKLNIVKLKEINDNFIKK